MMKGFKNSQLYRTVGDLNAIIRILPSNGWIDPRRIFEVVIVKPAAGRSRQGRKFLSLYRCYSWHKNGAECLFDGFSVFCFLNLSNFPNDFGKNGSD